jgi:dihydroanticapsin dehydrogenase
LKLSGKVALITGGSRGIGFAIAKTLSENGASVVITSKNSEKLNIAKSKISNSLGVTCDIKKTNEVKNVVDETIKKFGRLDILVNNAGVFPKTSGCIINISSDAGLKAYQGFNADAYSATKAALIILTKCWALEYAKDKIRVNCICPGVVDTDMTKPFLKNQKDIEFMNNEHPLGRIGQPEEIGKAVLYFVSDDASWVTGAILTVDGGESIK